jgi:hypothetical protein
MINMFTLNLNQIISRFFFFNLSFLFLGCEYEHDARILVRFESNEFGFDDFEPKLQLQLQLLVGQNFEWTKWEQ